MPLPLVPLIAGAATLGAAGIASAGQAAANRANERIARENREFQERMRNTSYQAAVKDMREAGLNPALAYTQGGAATPSGSTAEMRNAASPLGAGVATAAQVALTVAQADKTRAEADQIRKESEGRVDLLGTSAEWNRTQSARGQREIMELMETWRARREMPALQNVAKELENAYASGTLAERVTAAKIANDLNRARIPWEEGRGAVAKAVARILLPYLRVGADAPFLVKKLLDGLPSPGDVRVRGSDWLAERGLGHGTGKWTWQNPGWFSAPFKRWFGRNTD